MQFATSLDGYVRLTLADVLKVRLRHLLSELDFQSMPIRLGTGASAVSITGFTEWVSDTFPALSFGWDWQLDGSDSRVKYLRSSPIRSNVMLIDEQRRDVGSVATAARLCDALDRLNWQEAVQNNITSRYS